MAKQGKEDKTATRWVQLGKISVDIRLTQSRLAQLQQKYQEVYQSIQAIKTGPETSSNEGPKT